MRFDPPNGPHVMRQDGGGPVIAMRIRQCPVWLTSTAYRPGDDERWCVVHVQNNVNKYYFGTTGRGWKNLRDVRRVFDRLDNMLRVRGVCIGLKTEIQL